MCAYDGDSVGIKGKHETNSSKKYNQFINKEVKISSMNVFPFLPH